MRLMITGGAGFIGSAVVRHFLNCTDAQVLVVDKLTYAGSLANLPDDADALSFEKVDICDSLELRRVFTQYQPDAVLHLAAESHVDRSICSSQVFVSTNVEGTRVLLNEATAHWSSLSKEARQAFRFLHVSTDEVYGDLGPTASPATESRSYAPSSPYAASKAASDHFVRAWHRTFGLPTMITNCSNNYGPRQHPEKLIPLMITNAINKTPLPIYGDGQQIRDWLHVDDHASALACVLTRGVPGDVYHVGGSNERSNLEIVEAICRSVAELMRADVEEYLDLIRFVPDRPGHDQRYALDPSHISRSLGWRASRGFSDGLSATVEWYLGNDAWVHEARRRSQ